VARKVPVHYVRGNRREWTPRHVICLDTETWARPEGRREVLALRHWCGVAVDRHPEGGRAPTWRWGEGQDRRGLAAWVDTVTAGQRTTWLYCHNLGFDLTVSRLPDLLWARGWTLTEWRFAGRNVTGSLRSGKRGLRLCDSVSLLNMGLGRVGRLLGAAKLPLPADADPDEVWAVYCRRDVDILAAALLAVLGWWEENRLGHWSATGPGCGWAAWRHHPPAPRLLIRPDPAEIAYDRRAVYGGRRDLTRVGVIEGGPFALLDFQRAHLTVAATALLPAGRLRPAPPRLLEAHARGSGRIGVMAEVTVATESPRYPYRTPGGVLYPTGRFRTVLAGPELTYALDHGQVAAWHGGWLHTLGEHLQPWAAWCQDLLDQPAGAVPPIVQAVVKQWGRSVIGRFAGRHAHTEDRGPAQWPGWHLERGGVGRPPRPAADVHVAGRHWWITFDHDADDAYPAVLAWVEAHVRVALGNVLDALGEDCWRVADTDGVVVDLSRAPQRLRGGRPGLEWDRGAVRAGQALCGALSPLCGLLTPRVKAIGRRLDVTGPQHYATEAFSRAAGQPAQLERGGDGSWEAWLWPRAAWQMAHGSPDGFVRVRQPWTEPSRLAHRWILVDGRAVAPRVGDTGTDGPGVLAWAAMPGAGMPGLSAGGQAAVFEGLY
jgi:hypothetical protein